MLPSVGVIADQRFEQTARGGEITRILFADREQRQGSLVARQRSNQFARHMQRIGMAAALNSRNGGGDQLLHGSASSGLALDAENKSSFG